MGVVKNVGFSKWPRQGDWLGRRVRVVFEYDTANEIGGESFTWEKPFRRAPSFETATRLMRSALKPAS